jgi:hypothetical protein
MAKVFHRLKGIPDNIADSPIYVDVWIDEEVMIDDRQPIFGFQGDLASSGQHSVPFIIRRHGMVDFGSEGYPEEERKGNTNLLDMKIKDGAMFTWSGHGYSGTYRIAPL